MLPMKSAANERFRGKTMHFSDSQFNRLNYIRNNPLTNKKSKYFTSTIRKGMDPARVSWNSLYQFND